MNLKNIVRTVDNDPHLKVIKQFDNARRCLEYLRTDHEIDILFLDVSLYEGSCFDLIEWLEREKLRVPPVFIISAHIKEEYQNQAFNVFDHHIVGWVQKPFDVSWKRHRQQWWEKVQAHLAAQGRAPKSVVTDAPKEYIACMNNGKMEVVQKDNIVYVRKEKRGGDFPKEALYVYTDIQEEPFIAKEKVMDKLEIMLGGKDFIRCDRVLIIAYRFVQSPGSMRNPDRYWTTVRAPGNPELPLSRNGYRRLLEGLGIK